MVGVAFLVSEIMLLCIFLQISYLHDFFQKIISLFITYCYFSKLGEYVGDIYLCYCEEQHLYRCIVDDVLKQKNRDTLLVYLSCWIHEPCISEDMKMKLESLLIDSGLKND